MPTTTDTRLSPAPARASAPLADTLRDPLVDPLSRPVQAWRGSPLQLKGDVDKAGPTFRRVWVTSNKRAVDWLKSSSGLDADQYEAVIAFLPAGDQAKARQLLGIVEAPDPEEAPLEPEQDAVVEQVIEEAINLAQQDQQAAPPAHGVDDAQQEQEEQEEEEEEEEEDPGAASFGVWREFMAANAQPEETQRFGVEIELKTIEIPYDDRFLQWAKTYGHRNVFKHNKLPLSVQLDQAASGKGALLELVTDPLVEQALGTALFSMRAELSKVKNAQEVKEWLAAKCTPADHVPAWVLSYIDENLSMGKGQFFPNMVQVTTTLTAAEMAKVRPGPLMTAPRVSYPKPDEIAKHGDAAIQGFLKKLPAHDTVAPAKGSSALIKHAAEQFAEDGGGIDENESVTKLGKDGPLAGLHTRANKIAKLYTRKGQIAYVVELRGADPVTDKIARWLNSTEPASDVAAILKVMKA